MQPNLSLPSSRHSSAQRHVLIYFIPGNPGVVDFYADFLHRLRALLDADADAVASDTAYDVYARNLLGFHDDDGHAPFSAANPPYGLRAQVAGIDGDVSSRRGRRPDSGTAYDAVVLVGHSIGAYIALEILHQQQQRLQHTASGLHHAVLLFPTVSHLARSPSGAALLRLRRRGGVLAAVLEDNLHRVARALLWPWPRAVVGWVWRRLGFSRGAAAAAADWLGSRDGVWQAIHLGRSELRVLGGAAESVDVWDGTEGFWGEEGAARRRFWFFFGREDHWVDNGARDAFIEAHKGRGAGFHVDEGDIPHAFCTRRDSSLEVAQKVHEWIGEMKL